MGRFVRAIAADTRVAMYLPTGTGTGTGTNALLNGLTARWCVSGRKVYGGIFRRKLLI